MVGQYACPGLLIPESGSIFFGWLTSLVPGALQLPAVPQCPVMTGRIVVSGNTEPRPTLTVLAGAKLLRGSSTYARVARSAVPAVSASCCVLSQLCCVVAASMHDSHDVVYVRMNEQAKLPSLVSFWDLVCLNLAYLPCYVLVSWRSVDAWGVWEGGRELAVIMVLAL